MVIVLASVWKLKVWGGAYSGEYPGLDGSEYVDADLDKLNTAGITCKTAAGPIPVGTFVTINSWDGIVNREVFCGWIKKYTMVTKATGNFVVYRYEMAEYAAMLEQVRIHTATPSYVVNFAGGTLTDAVGVCVANTGWGVGSASSDAITQLQFYWTTVMAGLKKTIVELGAATGSLQYKMWFDSTSAATVGAGATPKVYWGATRNDLTSWNFTAASYYQYEDQKNNNKKEVNGVVVMGQNDACTGSYPDPIVGSKLAVYRYQSATTSSECTLIAQRLYTDYLKDPEHRIQFYIRPEWAKVGYTYIQEGDVIQVDGSNYTVVELYTTPKQVTVSLNAGETTFQTLFSDQLAVVDGDIQPFVEQSWDGGWQNVAADAAVETEWTFTVKDIARISDVMLKVETAKYRTDVTTPIVTQLLSVPGRSTANSAAADVTGYTTNIIYIPSATGVRASYAASGFQNGLALLSGDFTIETSGGAVFGIQAATGNSSGPVGAWSYLTSTTQNLISTRYKTYNLLLGISGSTTPEDASWCMWYRMQIIATYNLKGVDMCMSIDRVERHTHAIGPQTDTVVDVGTDPGECHVKVIDGAGTTTNLGIIASGAIRNITTYLSNGNNRIVIAQSSGKCSTRLTATYGQAGS